MFSWKRFFFTLQVRIGQKERERKREKNSEKPRPLRDRAELNCLQLPHEGCARNAIMV